MRAPRARACASDSTTRKAARFAEVEAAPRCCRTGGTARASTALSAPKPAITKSCSASAPPASTTSQRPRRIEVERGAERDVARGARHRRHYTGPRAPTARGERVARDRRSPSAPAAARRHRRQSSSRAPAAASPDAAERGAEHADARRRAGSPASRERLFRRPHRHRAARDGADSGTPSTSAIGPTGRQLAAAASSRARRRPAPHHKRSAPRPKPLTAPSPVIAARVTEAARDSSAAALRRRIPEVEEVEPLLRDTCARSARRPRPRARWLRVRRRRDRACAPPRSAPRRGTCSACDRRRR